MPSETDSNDPGFGRTFTPHMAVARYDARVGWSELEVVPFAELPMSPAAMVFHYGQAIFEGLKAFRQPDGSVALFRPDDNAARFDASARRLAMPELPTGLFTSACVELVRADAQAVPAQPGQSLYLRPTMIATEAALGVRSAHEYLFMVIASPVGSYFPSASVRPIVVWATDDYVRAAPGGTGAAKCAGNYAAGLAAKDEALVNGCDEALWLDAAEHRWIEELGGMNIVFVPSEGTGTTLVTPPIHDTILDGVTRKSLLAMAERLGYDTVERPVSLDELCQPGTFTEAFACGTAAVIAPVGGVGSPKGHWNIGDGNPGPVTTRLREALVAIQEGRADDPSGWMMKVTEPATSEVAAV
jgi:branched-chain amino acid aminotransferase